jgi:CBS domain-containing protein
MSISYTVIELFTSEEARWGKGAAIVPGVIEYVAGLKIGARCMVTRGIAGSYENGELATARIEVLGANMPLKIEIVLPTSEAQRVLNDLAGNIAEGVIMVGERRAVAHGVHARLIPRHLKVRDVMTPNPVSAHEDTPAREIIARLLPGDFHALPVVDTRNKPVGIITQNDLIRRGNIPIRLGILADLLRGTEQPGELPEAMMSMHASAIMTAPAVVVRDDMPLARAVELMLGKSLKRLPVVDADGALVGMLARLDVFRTVTRQTPDWKAMQGQRIRIEGMDTVRDILRRDVQTVAPDTPIEQVLAVIDENDIQRVAVVDAAGRLLGLISDRDLLARFSAQRPTLWQLLLDKTPLLKSVRARHDVLAAAAAQTAREVMKTDLVSVREDTTIPEAVALMTRHALKRLPVVDDHGLFKGMISRDAVLRAGIEPE